MKHYNQFNLLCKHLTFIKLFLWLWQLLSNSEGLNHLRLTLTFIFQFSDFMFLHSNEGKEFL